jgi:hypothetical protein
MAYLGNAPARSFISFERQVFTIVNSQTAYTLDHSVNNENDIRLVINNIVQEPGSGKAYTASGTTLTLSAALTNGTDEMYCVFLGRATATNAPGAGSVNTAAIAADAVTEAKIADDAVESEHLNDNVISGQTELAVAPASTDELLISDGGTLKRIDVSLIGGDNTPAFRAYMNANQNLSNNTTTKIDQFGTEDFDTDNNFASNRFTPTTAGKYFVYAQLGITNTVAADFMYYGATMIYKNGSELVRNYIDPKDANPLNTVSPAVATVVDMNGSSDYLEVYAHSTTGSDQPKIGNGTNQSYFGAYKIIT